MQQSEGVSKTKQKIEKCCSVPLLCVCVFLVAFIHVFIIIIKMKLENSAAANTKRKRMKNCIIYREHRFFRLIRAIHLRKNCVMLYRNIHNQHNNSIDFHRHKAPTVWVQMIVIFIFRALFMAYSCSTFPRIFIVHSFLMAFFLIFLRQYGHLLRKPIEI